MSRPAAGDPVLVKICGLTSRVDAELARSAGADLLGFIFVAGTPRALAPESAGWIRELAGSGNAILVQQLAMRIRKADDLKAHIAPSLLVHHHIAIEKRQFLGALAQGLSQLRDHDFVSSVQLTYRRLRFRQGNGRRR